MQIQADSTVSKLSALFGVLMFGYFLLVCFAANG
jgi:hypothetical protein